MQIINEIVLPFELFVNFFIIFPISQFYQLSRKRIHQHLSSLFSSVIVLPNVL